MKRMILKAKVPLIVYFHRLKPAVSLTYNVTPQFNLNELCRNFFSSHEGLYDGEKLKRFASLRDIVFKANVKFINWKFGD